MRRSNRRGRRESGLRRCIRPFNRASRLHFIRPVVKPKAVEPSFCFGHILIRAVQYASVCFGERDALADHCRQVFVGVDTRCHAGELRCCSGRNITRHMDVDTAEGDEGITSTSGRILVMQFGPICTGASLLARHYEGCMRRFRGFGGAVSTR